MKEADRIRLENTAQLGSLEDYAPVKRLEPSQIRRMRAQTQEQTKLGFSMVRWFRKTWSGLKGSLGFMFAAKPMKQCVRNGHTAYTAYGGVTRCRYCGIEIHSQQQLVPMD